MSLSDATPCDTMLSKQPLKSEDIISLLIFWGLAMLLFAQFFSRYVLSASLGWSEEIARYLLILLAFSGASIASRNDLTVVLLLTFYGDQIALSLQVYTLASLSISISWVYVLMCVCLLLMGARSWLVVVANWRLVCNTFKPAVGQL